jgi:uncharacterized membrane protein
MQIFRKDTKMTPSWDLVQPSIKLLQDNIWPVFYLAFLPGLVATLGLVIMSANRTAGSQELNLDGRHLAGLGILVVGALLSMLVYPAVVYLQLRATRGEHPDALECLKNGLPFLFKMIGMSIITAIVIFFGIIAFIIPGLILLRALYLAPYFLIDQKLGPIEALKASYEASKPNAGYIWGVIGVIMVFGIFGSIVGKMPIVGPLLSLATGLLYAFAPALRYREIIKTLPIHNATADAAPHKPESVKKA